MKKVIFLIIMSLIFNSLHSQTTTAFKFPANSTIDQGLLINMQNNTNALFKEINSAYSNKSKLNISTSIVNQSGIDAIQSLWKNESFMCDDIVVPVSRVLEEEYKSFGKINIFYFVRNIKVYFKKSSYQLINIAYDGNGKIRDLYRCSLKHDYQLPFEEEKNAVTDFRHRQMVVDFINMYRNYYNTKDIDNIATVFSNDALIITGTVYSTNGSEMQPSTTRIKYKQQDKTNYINNLRKNLHIGDDTYKVNIQFDNINVVQHKVNKNVYGVRIWQRWNTTGYSDVGWLFLIIDFTDEDKPQIWVRTWQPDVVNKKDVFGLDDFPIE